MKFSIPPRARLETSLRAALTLLALAAMGAPHSSFGDTSALGCAVAEEWNETVKTTVREAADVERLSLALTSTPACTKVVGRSNYLCSWKIQERLFADSSLAGNAAATVVCTVDSRGMIAAASPERERDQAVASRNEVLLGDLIDDPIAALAYKLGKLL